MTYELSRYRVFLAEIRQEDTRRHHLEIKTPCSFFLPCPQTRAIRRGGRLRPLILLSSLAGATSPEDALGHY